MSHKFLVSLPDNAYAELHKLMAEDMQTKHSPFIARLIAEERRRREQEKSRKSPGRPKKGEDDANGTGDELPDENEPRTLKNPYPDLVPLFDKDKLVNAYDIMMLEEKQKHHDGNEGRLS